MDPAEAGPRNTPSSASFEVLWASSDTHESLMTDAFTTNI